VLGAPDILVNNAGVYPRVKLLEMRESDWDYVLDINLKAGCFATIAFVKALTAAGKGTGSVINISSQAIRGAVRGVHYSASKGGVVALTRLAAVQYGPRGVRVNCICPGAVNTPMAAGAWDSDASRARMKRDVPLGVVAEAGDIGSVAGFLLSPDAHHLTGQVIAVDARDDRVPQAHPRDRTGHAQRLQRVVERRLAGLDVAEPAAARAGVAEDHERRGAALPAVADVRAGGLLADRVQPLALDHPAQLAVARAAGRRALEPFGLAVAERPHLAHLQHARAARVGARARAHVNTPAGILSSSGWRPRHPGADAV